MKHRYIVRTYVEASTPQEALKLAKITNPHEVNLDQDVWKAKNYALAEEIKKQIGYAPKVRPAVQS
jgi:hypothetical protein